MAKIKGSDLIEDGALNKFIEDGKTTLKVLRDIEKALRATAKASAEVAKTSPTNDFKSIQAKTKAINDTKKATEGLSRIEKERIKLGQRLKDLNSDKIQKNEALKILIKEQTKENQRLARTELEKTSALKKQAPLTRQQIKDASRLKLERQQQAKADKDLAREESKLSSAYDKQSAKLNRLRKELKNLILTEGKSTTATRALQKRVSALDKELKNADAAAGQFQRSVGNYPKAFRGALNALRSFGLALGGLAIVRNVLGVVKDFGQATADLGAISGKSAEELQPLTDQAKELGRTTQFSATQITELQTELAKLGFTSQQIQQSTEPLSNFAAATGADLAAAAKLGGSALRAFGLDASEMERVVSTLGVATTKSALDFQKLEAGLSTVAPVANAFGFSIEDTTALLGQLSNAGFDASSAATATRNILLNLADANGDLAQQLGRPIKSADDLAAGLSELKDSGIDLATALELTDKRSVAAFSTFLENSDGLVPLRDSITDVNDELTEMAEKRLDTVNGSLKLLSSAWEGFIIDLNEGTGASSFLKDSIKFLADNLVNIIKVITTAGTAFVTYKVSVFAITKAQQVYAASTKILAVTQALLTGNLKKARAAMRLFNITTKANPIGLLVAVVTTAIVAFKAFFSELSRGQKVQQTLANIQLEAAKATAQEKAQLDILLITARNKNLSDEKRVAAIEKINAISPELLGNITLENIGTKETTDAINNYIIALDKKAQAQAAENQLVQLYTDLINEQSKVTTDNVGVTEGLTSVLGGFGNATVAVNKANQAGIDIQKENIATIKAKIEAVKGLISTQEQAKDAQDQLSGAVDANTSEAQLGLIKDINEKIKAENENLVASTSVGGIRAAQAEIKALQKQKDALLGVHKAGNKKIIEEETGFRSFFKEAVDDQIALEKEQAEELEFQYNADLRAFEEFIAEDKRLRAERLKDEDMQYDFEIALYDQFLAEEKELNDKRKEEERKQLEERTETIAKGLEGINNIVQKRSQERIDAIDREVAASQTQQDLLRTIAQQGVADADENLAFEQQKQAELEQRKQKEIERAANLELVLTAVQTYNGEIQAGASPGEALSSTAVSLVALEALVGGLDLFFDGTENTGTVAQPLDSNGGRLAVLHDNERVMSAAQNDVVGSLTNWELANLAGAYQKGTIGMQNAVQVHAFADSGAILSKFDELKASIDNKPAYMGRDYSETERAVIETVKSNNKTIRNHYKTKGGLW